MVACACSTYNLFQVLRELQAFCCEQTNLNAEVTLQIGAPCIVMCTCIKVSSLFGQVILLKKFPDRFQCLTRNGNRTLAGLVVHTVSLLQCRKDISLLKPFVDILENPTGLSVSKALWCF